MNEPYFKLDKAVFLSIEKGGTKPHHLPHTQKRAKKPAFLDKGHKRDTFSKYTTRMRAPSEPQINRENPNEYFIYWNHDVPQLLWHKYPRKRIRIKKKDNINRYSGPEKEEYAEKRRMVWKYSLENLNYNPFEDELAELNKIEEKKEEIIIKKAVKEKPVVLTVSEQRKLTPINKACDLWVESKKDRTKNNNSISTYRVTATWFKAHFEALGEVSRPIDKLTSIEITEALMTAKQAKGWNNTTFNNEKQTLIGMFIWLQKNEYIKENLIKGKIDKLKEKKYKHTWYDKDTKDRVKKQLIEDDEMLVYHVMEFTYYILIRSKTELMKLKACDIDRTLKRVRYTAELDKEDTEAFRDYEPEFDMVLDAINFDAIPKNFFIFGKNGEPSEYKCHKDLFAVRWRPVRDKLGLPDKYTIYGMKHTRIVHELMKNTDGNDISYMARHNDPKSTKAYMRDYDLSLRNVYKPEDLKF